MTVTRKETKRNGLIRHAVVVPLFIATVCAAAGEGTLSYNDAPPRRGRWRNISFRTFTKPDDMNTIGITSPHAVVASTRVGDRTVSIAIDCSKPGGNRPDVVRLDVAGRGTFAGGPVLNIENYNAGGNRTHFSIRGQKRSVTAGGRAIPVWFSARYFKNERFRVFSLETRVVAAGTCRFGAAVRKVRVLDTSANFTIGDPLETPVKSSVPLTGDTFRIAGKDGTFSDDSALLYLGQPVRLGGAWYVVTVADMTIAARPFDGGLGNITADFAQMSSVLSGDRHYVAISSTEKVVTVPADRYRIVLYKVARKAPGGVTLCGYYCKGKKAALVVTDGGTTAFPDPAPIVGAVSTVQRGTGVVFSLKTTDALDSRAVRVMDAKGKAVPAPVIEVYDAAGRKVYTATMRYGSGGTCSGTWRVPAELKGSFRLKTVYETGAFAFKSRGGPLVIE